MKMFLMIFKFSKRYADKMDPNNKELLLMIFENHVSWYLYQKEANKSHLSQYIDLEMFFSSK